MDDATAEREVVQLVVAVIVTYQPKPEKLARLLRLVSTQVHRVCVVDNGTPEIESIVGEHASAGFHLVRNTENVGLARAQNQGIAYALSAGARFILLLDQDSEPAPNMVDCLLRSLIASDRFKTEIAAAAPVFSDPAAGITSRFSQIRCLGVRRIACTEDSGIVPAEIVIASGMLISASAIHRIGMMEDALFIDQVDTEWCLRARSLGFSLIGVCGARMTHRLGDSPGPRFLGRQFFVRSPARHYYFARNTILLLGRPYPPLGWKLWQGLHLLLFLATVAAVCKPRRHHIKAVWLGIVDGVRGRAGPLSAPSAWTKLPGTE